MSKTNQKKNLVEKLSSIFEDVKAYCSSFKKKSQYQILIREGKTLKLFQTQIKGEKDITSFLKEKEKFLVFESKFLNEDFATFAFNLINRSLRTHERDSFVYRPRGIELSEILLERVKSLSSFLQRAEYTLFLKTAADSEKIKAEIDRARKEIDDRYYVFSFEKPEEATLRAFKLELKQNKSFLVVYDDDYNFYLVEDLSIEFADRKNLKAVVFEPEQIRKIDLLKKKFFKPIKVDFGYYDVDRSSLEYYVERLSTLLSKKLSEPAVCLRQILPEGSNVVVFSLKTNKPILRAKKIQLLSKNLDLLVVFNPKEGLDGSDPEKSYVVDLKDRKIICEHFASNVNANLFVSFDRLLEDDEEARKNFKFNWMLILLPNDLSSGSKNLTVIVETKDKKLYHYEYEKPPLTIGNLVSQIAEGGTYEFLEYPEGAVLIKIDPEKNKIFLFDEAKNEPVVIDAEKGLLIPEKQVQSESKAYEDRIKEFFDPIASKEEAESTSAVSFRSEEEASEKIFVEISELKKRIENLEKLLSEESRKKSSTMKK